MLAATGVDTGLHMRNYRPFDLDLQQYHLDYPQWQKLEEESRFSDNEDLEKARRRVLTQDPLLNSRPVEDVTVEAVVKRLLEEAHEKDAKQNEKQGDQQIDLMKLAPREPNWDLKRDLQPRLDKLEKRTKKAILELVKERFRQKDTAAEGLDIVKAMEIQEEIRLSEEQGEEES